MDHKKKVQELFGLMSTEVLSYIQSAEPDFSNGWVPATYIKDQLGLKMSAYPQGNKIDNETGWLFSTIARYLQDKNQVDFKKIGNRSYYKSRKTT
jgi:hypothetical protein